MDSPAHGGPVDDELAALGLRAGDVLDFSVNVNPYGPCPSVVRAIAEAPLDRYPDPSAAPTRRALAARLDEPEGRIILGNGAVDLLWLLARTWLRPGDLALAVEPTFSEMQRAAMQAGARILEHRTSPCDDFAIDITALDAQLRDARPRLVYVCTPSNPVGVFTPFEALEDLAERHPDTLFVCDVSFLSLSTHHAAVRRSRRIAWVCSLTKDHALPGLRIGYAAAPESLVARMEAERPPWSIGAPAQAAILAAFEPEARRFVDESRVRLLQDRAALEARLHHLDVRTHPSDTVYVLVDLGGRRLATPLRRTLLERHAVLVRDATSFGLPGHIRLAARPQPDAELLVSALRQELRP
ncbi:histidinol-phosphate aminotransferase family protein [Pendulispora rubella]|uniref:Aminotransferase n=1 Tax=Pendulispora rubella TaxID=2741070 RepID=A0ABZ2L790_9BACT